MEMLLEYQDHADKMDFLAHQNPDKVIISSYGLYAGITYAGQDTTEWGEKYKLRTREFLEILKRRGVQTQLLIGLPNYASCKYKKKCLDCEVKYAQQAFRLLNHADLYPEFEWRVTTKLHLKCYLFKYGSYWEGIAGGRNFSDSEWEDITFMLSKEQVSTLLDHTLKLWERSEDISEESIGALIEDQGICEQALIAMTNTKSR